MENTIKTVSMIGLGYIGLPTAAMFASRGIRVIGVDINKHAVDTINAGQIHIVEPELDLIVSKVVRQGYLRATTKPEPADAFLIAVPTPFIGDHEPDVSYVEAAAKSIATVLKKGDMVILESTSPVGTTEKMVEWLAEMRPDLKFPQQMCEESDINIAYCPERVLPGRVVQELVHNDRVIGGLTKTCSQRAMTLYKTFVEAECISTNARTAEMCKLVENSYRDVNIAFANELSIICEKLSIDVWELIKLANLHPRVKILQPGPGVGGHCIAVDPWFIVANTPSEAKLIRTAREINDDKPNWVINKVLEAIQKFLNNNPSCIAREVTVACFGLSFKPDIDDLRESPSLSIANKIAELHPGTILAVEPNISHAPDNLNRKILLCDAREAMAKAQVAVFLVAHGPFIEMNDAFKDGFPHIVDACGVLKYK